MSIANADERMHKNITEMKIKEMKDREMKKALKLCKTVEEAAKKLGISERLLYLFKKKNKL